MSRQKCGLFLTRLGVESRLPLQSVSARVHIVDVLAMVTLTQSFIYPDHIAYYPTGAKYVFPIPVGGAVCAFELRISDGRVVSGRVKEARQAAHDFDVAVAENKLAGRLDKEASDVFVMHVGSIKPGQSVKVIISYAMELADDELLNQVRFSLPTYIGERYGTPPGRLSGSSTTAWATFSVSVDIRMTSVIENVVSPSHGIGVAYDEERTRCSVVLNESSPCFLGREFILSIQAGKIDVPRCVAEVLPEKRSVALSLTLVPRFGVRPIEKQEYIFVIDRSGSMVDGRRMDYARNALLLMIKSLPSDGTFFNVVSFGSTHSSLWRGSQTYTSRSVHEAVTHVDAMTADMGGTNLLPTIEYVLRKRQGGIFRLFNRTRPKSVFVITDGEIWQHDDLFRTIRRAVAAAGSPSGGKYLRFFALGIGHGASTALCTGIARAGNGLCLMTTQSEDLAGKCARLLRASQVPPSGNLRNVRVDWGYSCADPEPRSGDKPEHTGKQKAKKEPTACTSIYDETVDLRLGVDVDFSPPSTPNVQQAPHAVPDFYPGNRFIVSAILSHTTHIPDRVLLRGETPNGEAMTLEVDVQRADIQPSLPPLVHALAVHRLVQELEDGSLESQGAHGLLDTRVRDAATRAAVIRYSEEFQIASKFASFVAVEREEPVDADDVTVVGDFDAELEWGKDLFDDLTTPMNGAYDETVSDVGWRPRRLAPTNEPSRTRDMGVSHGEYSMSADLSRQRTRRFSQPVSFSPSYHVPSSLPRGPAPAISGLESYQEEDPDDNPGQEEYAARGPSMARTAVKTQPEEVHDESDDVDFLREIMRHRDASKGPGPFDLGINKILQHARRSSMPAPSLSAEHRPPNVMPNNDPITDIARLQRFDGSFELDNALCSIISPDKLSLDGLRATIPIYIQAHPRGPQMWATVLAMAYLRAKVGNKANIWGGLWQKGKNYVDKCLHGGTVNFEQLVTDAGQITS